jgi:hypothetical protein
MQGQMFKNKRVSIGFIFSNDENIKFRLFLHFQKTHLRRSHVEMLTTDKFSKDIVEKIMNKHFDPLTAIIWHPLNQKNDCIAIVNSFQDGCAGFVQGFCEKNNLEYIYISFSSDHFYYSDFAKFQYYNSGKERTVYAISDEGKWEFFQKGEILSFENEAYYKRRSISNRLNEEILLEYLQKMGVDLAGKDFWLAKNDSFLFRMIREEVSLLPE